MRKKRVVILAMLIFLIFLIYLVNNLLIAPKKDIREAVERYNQVLQQALADVEPKKMLQVATLKEAQRVELYMMYLGKENKYLDSKLLSLEILEIKLAGSKAVASTAEKWEYRERDYNTHEVKNESAINYRNVYSLERQQGRWLVSKLDTNQQ